MENFTYKEMVQRFADIAFLAFGQEAKDAILKDNDYAVDEDSLEEHIVNYNDLVGVQKILDKDLCFDGFIAFANTQQQDYAELVSKTTFDKAAFIAMSYIFLENLKEKVVHKDFSETKSNVIQFKRKTCQRS